MSGERTERADLSIVIPTWNRKDTLEECLRSLVHAGSRVSTEWIVVDNGSEDRTAAWLAGAYPGILLIRNEKNLGFSRASNQGLRRATGRYVLLLNNDALVQPGTLENLVHFMDAHPEAGAAAPSLINPDGSLHVSACINYISLKSALFGGFQLPAPLDKWIPPMALPLEAHSEVREVAWVPGTCLIVRRETFDRVGLLDENIFMYMEDMEWCYRIRQGGWKVFFVPGPGVIHLKHHSSRENLEAVFKANFQSKKYFFRKYHSSRTASVFALFTLAGSLLKLPLLAGQLPFQGQDAKQETQYRLRQHLVLIKYLLFSGSQ